MWTYKFTFSPNQLHVFHGIKKNSLFQFSAYIDYCCFLQPCWQISASMRPSMISEPMLVEPYRYLYCSYLAYKPLHWRNIKTVYERDNQPLRTFMVPQYSQWVILMCTKNKLTVVTSIVKILSIHKLSFKGLTFQLKVVK